MAIRISGMNSGLDTDSIVQALVMDVKSKKVKLPKQLDFIFFSKKY